MLLGLAAVLIVFTLDRRLGILAMFCTGSDLAWYLLEQLIGRPRPDSQLVHVVRHASGGAYPSGHAVYYLWALVMLALALSRRLPARIRFLPWLVACVTMLLVCLGRIVYG